MKLSLRLVVLCCALSWTSRGWAVDDTRVDLTALQAGSFQASLVAGQVPEPSSAVAVLVLGSALWFARRRRLIRG